jgi:hypothetical protein
MSAEQKPCGNLTEYNARHHKYPEIEAAVAKFNADLSAQLGATPSPTKVALQAAAVTNYASILLIHSRLMASRGRYSQIETLVNQLPTLTGALQRTLRALGLESGDAGAQDEPKLDEWLKDWRARKKTASGPPSADFGSSGGES